MYVCKRMYQVVCEVSGELLEIVWRESKRLEEIPELLLKIRHIHGEDTRATEHEPG
jgi:hypothetical protein